LKINDGITRVQRLFIISFRRSKRINKAGFHFPFFKLYISFNCIFESKDNRSNSPGNFFQKNKARKVFKKFIKNLQMIRSKIYFILTVLFLNFYSLPLFAQGSANISKPAFDTLNKNENREYYLKPPALIIPATFIIYGGLKPVINDISKLDNRIMSHMQERYPDFRGNAADYLMWVPSASVYAMDAFKVKTAHNFKQHLILDAGSILITGGIGLGMRIISSNIKGFDSGNTGFPSGHTANAFRGAEILHQELKQNNKLLSYSGYVAATAVGVLRIYGKEHYLSQVVAGAGLGILSTKITYWIFDKIKRSGHSKEKVVL
jgi:membrane-associated phospholipid phosphatase